MNVRKNMGDSGLEGVCGTRNHHPLCGEEVDGVGVGGPVDLVLSREIWEL